jgi:pantoate--beta-alanine ligase
MILVRQITELRKMITEARQVGATIGLAPTMGYFHAGHLSLIQRAKAENDRVAVSIFVNPTQFGPQEDFRSYPRDLERDRAMAEKVGVDWLFVPEAVEMYPDGYQTFTEVTGLSQGLCGASRPGHFRGVATVVLKLLNIVAPDRAYFGEKDAQQLRVIKRMVTDLNLNVAVVGCPIIREADGLAMSSRNTYLTPEQRQAALVLFRTLCEAGRLLDAGERDAGRLRRKLLEILAAEPLADLDYLAIVANDTLLPVTLIEEEILIALAVKIGNIRLIDNHVYQLGNGGVRGAQEDV